MEVLTAPKSPFQSHLITDGGHQLLCWSALLDERLDCIKHLQPAERSWLLCSNSQMAEPHRNDLGSNTNFFLCSGTRSRTQKFWYHLLVQVVELPQAGH